MFVLDIRHALAMNQEPAVPPGTLILDRLTEADECNTLEAFLAALEQDLGTSIVDNFDLIAGTSTGGIIALGLGLGLSPKQIVDFYVKWGPTIFPKHVGSSLRHWITSKYVCLPLEAA